MVHALGLLVCNKGIDPTFKSGSIIDVTFCSPGMTGAVSGWCVLDVESLSDYSYIHYNIHSDQTPSPSVPLPSIKWKFNRKKLEDALTSELLPVASISTSAEECAVLLTSKIHEASMTKSVAGSGRKSVYWWSPGINVLRRAANYARRVFQRKKKRTSPLAASTEETAAKEAKLDLVKAKDRAWKVLCDQVENDPWCTPYKLVMGKLKRHQPIPGLDSPEVVSRIVNALFPAHPPRSHGYWLIIPESDLTDASMRCS